ncbi:hypothetical protein [Phyllobacterium myrsinacearum]|uniref:TnsA endonuclease N-terminal domain-containing protein n=1 Tax=Phyllobacterium myrsinacearum TaxID=28101 RepID=A0A839EP92_9HYPH|nr:hypothetical protein [Phyllobacterium myrsinacearum]MBA8878287.1 hypothetical protein [Phyllobacterium myrsinacearum]
MYSQKNILIGHATNSVDSTDGYFPPRGTVRCSGIARFRNQLARDYGCLLDLDADVSSWSCLDIELVQSERTHLPDFSVVRNGIQSLVDIIPDETGLPAWVSHAVVAAGYNHQVVKFRDVPQNLRLQNARDLLRYARWVCPLGDRIRIVAALDEHGSLSLSDCLSAFREIPPIAGLSSLILHRHIQIEIDDALIGPDTMVRHFER